MASIRPRLLKWQLAIDWGRHLSHNSTLIPLMVSNAAEPADDAKSGP